MHRMDNQHLFRLFEDRRNELGLTQAQVGELVLGKANTSAIQNIRRGASPSVDRVAALCAALDLEFYIGPKRDLVPAPSMRPENDIHLANEDYSLIARYDVNVSAGPGLVPTAEDEDGRLAFSRQWLSRHHINPETAGLVKVKGESMAPTIPDGALVLVNCAEQFVEREGIFAFSRSGEAYIKRLVPVTRAPDGRPTSMVIISDSGDFAPEAVSGEALNEMRVVGRVRSILIST